MLSALFALAFAQQDVQLGTVDVGGKQVAVTVPDLRGPYSAETPHVTVDGWNYAVGPDFSLGPRYRSDGGWGEVAEAYPAAARAAASAPEYRVKVFLLTNTMVLEHGSDGVWRERTGSMSPDDQNEVYAALARLKALAETAAGGAVRVTFDVTHDDDLVFRVSDGNAKEYRQTPGEAPSVAIGSETRDESLLGTRFIREEVAPRVNNEPFEGEDGKYHGPYSSVFVIHAVRSWDVSTYVLDRTPVTSVSWATFTERKPGPALSIQLFSAWLQHLSLSAKAHGHDLGVFPALLSGDSLPGVPHVFAAPLSAELLKFGNHLASPTFDDVTNAEGEFSAADAAALRLGRLREVGSEYGRARRAVTIVEAGGASAWAVRADLAAQFMRAHPEAKTLGLRSYVGETWKRVVFERAGTVETDCDVLGLKPNAVPALRMSGTPPTSGKLAFDPFGVGDFQTELGNDPLAGPAVTVNEGSYFRRGYAVLAAAESGDALFHVNPDSGLQFRVSCDLADSYVLRLVTKSGAGLDVQLFGGTLAPAESGSEAPNLLNLSRKPGPFWTEFKVAIGPELGGQDVVEVRLAPPAFATCYDRASDGSKSLKIGEISFGPIENPDKGMDAGRDGDMGWLQQLSAPLDEAAVQRATALLNDPRASVRLNALGAFTRVKHPNLIPEIAKHGHSAFYGEAYLCVSALRFQNDDRGWSQIAFTAIKGPSGHNFGFAAEALGDKVEDTTLQVLGVPLLAPSWHARLQAVRSMNKIDTEMGAIVASTVLSGQEPDPAVRFELVSKARSKSELYARRLLYAAVNDESEWVRAASCISLMDSSFAEIRDQALRGVRDESVTVKLAILAAMRAHPQEHYRAALQSAVTDRSPLVRAAALRALAVQPGDVLAAEVQNTFADRSPSVRTALQELARAKGIQVPPL